MRTRFGSTPPFSFSVSGTGSRFKRKTRFLNNLSKVSYKILISALAFGIEQGIDTQHSTYVRENERDSVAGSSLLSERRIMSRESVAGASSYSNKRSIFDKIKTAACLSSSSPDSGRGKSKSSRKRISHGFHLVEGKSGHDMEDYHVAEYRKYKNHELGLFAIFDGHLGDRVPNYLKDNLFNNILQEPGLLEDPRKAIMNAYRSTDTFILEKSIELGPGGSTAVTAILIDGKDLWVANVGDSRAVVCERGSANQLTVDHEPHMQMERKRIEKQGGFVTTLPGDVPRVNGQLAVARAFGDHSLKAHLTSEPDIRHVPIDITMEFIIIASDGLWKVMKNQEAVDLVKSTRDPQTAAKRLTTEALARKSKDDISCIVIRFG